MRIDRVWAMPNKYTFQIKPIKKLLDEEMGSGGLWLDPFCGVSSPANIRNDHNPTIPADFHLDCKNFLEMFPSSSVDGLLFDPPFSPRQIREVYEMVGMPTKGIWTNSSFYRVYRDAAARVIAVGGKALCFGWNTVGLGKKRGFELKRVLLVCHGGAHNDTIVTVEEKVNDGTR